MRIQQMIIVSLADIFYITAYGSRNLLASEERPQIMGFEAEVIMKLIGCLEILIVRMRCHGCA